MGIDDGKELVRLKKRSLYLKRVLLLLVLVLLAKAFYLQVVRGEYYRWRARNICLRRYQVRAPRGRIYDRKGRPLAINRPSFNFYVIPGYLGKGDKPLLLENLSKYLGLSKVEVEAKLAKNKGDRWTPLILKRDLSQGELALVEERDWLFPGTMVVAEGKRCYPHGPLAAHLLGYMGEVGEKELRSDDYYPGDMVGRSGVEKEYEGVLRGTPGWEQWEVDAHGKKRRLKDSSRPVPGDDIYLTLDLDLQEVAEGLLKGKQGAIVAMDPRTGEILAMASSPSFDPNMFVKGISPKEWEALSQNKFHPLQDRCIQGLYPAGSVFKIVVALAGLEEGKVKPKDEFFCPGGYPFGGRVYRCWKEGGHGHVDLRRAIVESCDVYFYNLGHELGVDAIHKYGDLLGLGKRTGIDLPHEKGGLLPSSRWKRKTLGEVWYPGETLSLAIGQGYLQVTPLQLDLMLSQVVNGGWKIRPHVLLKVVKGGKERPWKDRGRRKLPFKRWHLTFLKDALEGAVEDPHGTGRAARIPGVTVGGKTGTAQVVAMKEDEGRKEELPSLWREHAWFVAFAPVEDPKIAVAVLVEHGGHGGSAAAPLAREMIKAYLKRGDGHG